jgi:hypothetical protein
MTEIIEGMTPTEFINAVNSNFETEVTIDASSTVVDINTGFNSFEVINTGVTKELIAGLSALEFVTRLNANFNNTLNNTTKTLIDRFDIELASPQKQFYSDYYRNKLLVGTYWSKIVALYLYYQHDEQAVLQNWKQNLYNELLYDAPLYFLRFYGMESFGGLFAGYLNGGLDLSEVATSTSLSIKLDKDGGALRDGWIAGAHENASEKITGFYERPEVNGDIIYVAGTDGISYVFGEDPYEIAFSLNGANISTFKNGELVSGPTSKTITGLPPLDFTTFGRNKDGVMEKGAVKLKYKVISSRLTDTEQLALYNDLHWFINNIESVF